MGTSHKVRVSRNLILDFIARILGFDDGLQRVDFCLLTGFLLSGHVGGQFLKKPAEGLANERGEGLPDHADALFGISHTRMGVAMVTAF